MWKKARKLLLAGEEPDDTEAVSGALLQRAVTRSTSLLADRT